MRALNMRFAEPGEKPDVNASDLVHQFGALDVTKVSDNLRLRGGDSGLI